MSDSRSAYDEQLPWLEAVDDEDGRAAVCRRAACSPRLLVVLAAVALVSATFFWLGRRDSAEIGGAPELIRAEAGPYKIKPTDPGGLDVAGESETAFETSAGQDTDAQLDLSELPEAPVAAPKPAAEPKPDSRATRQGPLSRSRSRAEPEPQPTGGKGSVIQLGAFANRAQAERAWSALSARFPSVGSMTKLIVPFSGGIRLRAAAASPAEAKQACQALKVAGENCFVAELMQAAIYGLEGTGDHRRTSATSSAMPIPPASSCSGAIAQDREQMRRLTDGASRACRPSRSADPDRPGRRQGGADAAARMARFPAGEALRPALPAGAVERDRGGAGRTRGRLR